MLCVLISKFCLVRLFLHRRAIHLLSVSNDSGLKILGPKREISEWIGLKKPQIGFSMLINHLASDLTNSITSLLKPNGVCLFTRL